VDIAQILKLGPVQTGGQPPNRAGVA
jgi:hypothetical protein